MKTTSEHYILIVDDEPEVREVLQGALEMDGYSVVAVPDGKSTLQAMELHNFSLIILDLRLQGEDGLSLARKIRETDPIPIMMLTGKGDETDRILGLELAADDYLMKPFNVREIIARTHALIRRSTRLSTTFATPINQKHERLSFGNWILDLTARELRSKTGERVELTYGEFDLLEVLVSSPNKVFSRDELLEKTRGHQSDVYDRTIDVQILRIRRKIEPNPKLPCFIKTERGVGYVFGGVIKKDL